MVGVPHSNGCRACIQRRVKCDQTRPECRRCQARATRCPGYRKVLKFYHTTPRADEFTDASTVRNAQQIVRRSGARTPKRPPMDESVAPNLVIQALDLQLKDVFGQLVTATFPVTFATFSQRVNPDWKRFIQVPSRPHSAAITLSVRCLNTWYLAKQHADADKIAASRHMYIRALRYLGGLLRNPDTVRSDVTLACATLLGVYELCDGIASNSWLVHARGIAALFRLRGPEAHVDGFGRTLFTTYRSFLVAEALIHQEPCFLAEPEWRQMILDSLALEERDGHGSRIGTETEHLFSEIVFCPGFYRMTRDLITQGGSKAARDTLVEEIRRSQGIMRRLQQRLSLIERESKPEQASGTTEGPIPARFYQPIAQFSLDGADSALALLDQLLVILETHKHQDSGTPTPDGAVVLAEKNPWKRAEFRPPVLGTVENHTEERPTNWVDGIAMTMGLLAIKS